MLCLDGQFDAQVFDGTDMQEIAVGPGDALLFAPQVWVDVHHQRCKRYLRITYDEDHILCGLKDCSSAQKQKEIGDLATWVYPRTLNKHGQSIIREIESLPRDRHADERYRDYCKALLWQTRDALTYQQPHLDGTESTWLAVRDWCARNCLKGISRRDACDAFQLSPGYLSRLCKSHSGMTFIDFIHELQLRHAQSYLRESTLSIAAIALACGFNSANYFIRIFNKHCNKSPEQWRRQYLHRT